MFGGWILHGEFQPVLRLGLGGDGRKSFGAWFLTKQRKLGFLIGTIGCIGWLVFGIVAESMPSVISNLIYIGINIRGWWKWKKNPPRECAQEGAT